MCKVLPPSPRLPYPLIRLPPDSAQMIDQRRLQRRCRNPYLIVGLRSSQQRRRHLSKYIQLKLIRRRIPNPHRRRSPITRKPIRNPFCQLPLSINSIDRLNLIRRTRSSSQQPLPPRNRLIYITRLHQHQQRKRRIAQPAVSIIPVARSPHSLRQRSRHRRDNSSRWPIRQSLQCNQRPFYGLCIRSTIFIPLRPSFPESARLHQRLTRIDSLRQLLQRRPVRQRERHPLALRKRKLTDRRHPFASQPSRRSQHHPVRPCNRLPVAAFARHPRNRPPIVEADRQIHPHCHAPPYSPNHSHYIRVLSARRHKIRHPYLTPCRLKRRLHNQGPRLILPSNSLHLRLRSNLPESVILRPHQRSKTCSRRETRPAKPIDRTFARHKRSRLTISNQAIVLGPRPMRPALRPLFRLDHFASPSPLSALLQPHPTCCASL
jgi:hypothetical protein